MHSVGSDVGDGSGADSGGGDGCGVRGDNTNPKVILELNIFASKAMKWDKTCSDGGGGDNLTVLASMLACVCVGGNSINQHLVSVSNLFDSKAGNLTSNW